MPDKVLQEVADLRKENDILRNQIEILTKKHALSEAEREANVKAFTDSVIEQTKKICELEQQFNDRRRIFMEKSLKDVSDKVKMAFYYHFDEMIPSIMADEIDKILEEVLKGDR